jgi:hypothetical protein
MTSTKANRWTAPSIPACLKGDPTIGVRVGMPKSDGFRTWSEDALPSRRSIRWSKAQFALARLLNPALRCSLTWSAWAGAVSGVARNPGWPRGQRVREQKVPAPNSCSAIVLKIPLLAEFPMDKSIATGL